MSRGRQCGEKGGMNTIQRTETVSPLSKHSLGFELTNNTCLVNAPRPACGGIRIPHGLRCAILTVEDRVQSRRHICVRVSSGARRLMFWSRGRTNGWTLLSFSQYDQAEAEAQVTRSGCQVCDASASRLKIYIRHSSASTLHALIGSSGMNTQPGICRWRHCGWVQDRTAALVAIAYRRLPWSLSQILKIASTTRHRVKALLTMFTMLGRWERETGDSRVVNKRPSPWSSPPSPAHPAA